MKDEKKDIETRPEPISFLELTNLVNQWFLVDDQGIIRLLCATVIANRLAGDPVWLFIVAPPSGLKTELLNSLDRIVFIHPLSSLTPQTLISGQKSTENETSLIFTIDGKILTFKDFTTILEMNHTARGEILSQLREIFDGKYSKSFGNGQNVSWEGKVGFIAGVTGAIDLYQSMLNVLGERFIQYRMGQPDRKLATKKGINNSGSIVEIRKKMKEAFLAYFIGVDIPKTAPILSESYQEEIINLCNFATLARAGVVRDPRTREVTHAFEPEMPVRFAKQLSLIAQALILMGSIEDQDRKILAKIAISSVPKNRANTLEVLAKNRSDISLEGLSGIDDDENEEMPSDQETEWTTPSVAVVLGMPTTSTRRILEELNILGLVDRKKNGGKADLWIMKEEYQKIFRRYYVHSSPVKENPNLIQDVTEVFGKEMISI